MTNVFEKKGTEGPHTGKLEFLETVRGFFGLFLLLLFIDSKLTNGYLYLCTNVSWRIHDDSCNGTWQVSLNI